ncbi:MAG: hypothetical protein QM775_35065 [Pirellulales bacterium]
MNLDRLQQRLTETLDDLYACYVDPREPYGDDDTRWLAMGAGTTRHAADAAAQTEAELAALRGECRALALQNEFAVNGHENRVSYIVGAGHKYRAVAGKRQQPPPQLVADVQRLLDDFVRVNRWARRQQEAALRLDRDGEVFLRYFTTAEGLTLVRFIEPGQMLRAGRSGPRSLAVVRHCDRRGRCGNRACLLCRRRADRRRCDSAP